MLNSSAASSSMISNLLVLDAEKVPILRNADLSCSACKGLVRKEKAPRAKP